MGFEIVADSELINVDGFQIAPAEADNLKGAVSFAGGMRDFDVLPPFIHFHQFKVNFFENGTLTLARGAGNEDEILFNFDRIDELVLAIDTASAISADKKKLNPSVRHTGSLDMFNTGDIIEGR